MLILVIAVFGIVQALLGLRLILPLFGVPEQLQPLLPAFLQVTDLLIAPFSAFRLPGGGGFPGFGAGGMDVSVIPALIGWSIVGLVVVGLLRLFGAGRRSDRDRRGDWDSVA